MKAWHFVADTLRNGDPIPVDGVTLRHEGDVVMCKSGLHASVHILHALHYAPGTTVCRVECGGYIIHDADKLVCTERTILWRKDVGDALVRFACLCALNVAHMWDAPPIVIAYLRHPTPDTARDALGAWDAARDAYVAQAAQDARDAALAALYALDAWGATRYARYARNAARYVARSAARDPCDGRDAAWAAQAARDAARDVWGAAYYAAQGAAWAGAYHGGAAWDAARSAELDWLWFTQNRRLTGMVRAARRVR